MVRSGPRGRDRARGSAGEGGRRGRSPSRWPARLRRGTTSGSGSAGCGAYELRFRIGALRYVVLANLSESPLTRALAADAFARGEDGVGRFFAADEVVSLPPHGSLSLLEDSGGEVALVGSEGSLFPGADVEELSARGDESAIVRSERARGRGKVLVRIPRAWPGCRVNGVFVQAARYGGREGLLVLDSEALPRGRGSA